MSFILHQIIRREQSKWRFRFSLHYRHIGVGGCRLYVISISSPSFAAVELRFGTQTPHLNATKYSEGIFEILSGG